MTSLTALVALLLSRPSYIAIIVLSLIMCGLGASTFYYHNKYSNTAITLQAEKDRANIWQNRFTQLQTSTNDQNTKVAELEKEKTQVEAKAADLTGKITDLDKRLADQQAAIRVASIPENCKESLKWLVDHTKVITKDFNK